MSNPSSLSYDDSDAPPCYPDCHCHEPNIWSYFYPRTNRYRCPCYRDGCPPDRDTDNPDRDTGAADPNHDCSQYDPADCHRYGHVNTPFPDRYPHADTDRGSAPAAP